MAKPRSTFLALLASALLIGALLGYRGLSQEGLSQESSSSEAVRSALLLPEHHHAQATRSSSSRPSRGRALEQEAVAVHRSRKNGREIPPTKETLEELFSGSGFQLIDGENEGKIAHEHLALLSEEERLRYEQASRVFHSILAEAYDPEAQSSIWQKKRLAPQEKDLVANAYLNATVAKIEWLQRRIDEELSQNPLLLPLSDEAEASFRDFEGKLLSLHAETVRAILDAPADRAGIERTMVHYLKEKEEIVEELGESIEGEVDPELMLEVLGG